MTTHLPKISDWLDGKDIFITGVTGFLGKVLLEKLIRCTPGLNRIYVLIRCKRGKTIRERVDDLKKFELFDIVNEKYPNWSDKVIPIDGDTSKVKLGMCDNDWNILKENVSVIFHSAASVRFDDPLMKAILLNVRGTREMCQLALESKKLEVFVHVSTTYCNNHYKIVDEKLYEPLGDWRRDIEIATEMDEQELNIVTKLFTHRQTNTYTYTKGVAESLVNDLCAGKIPTVILRPTIVTPTLEEPFPGWIDNVNGPGAIFLGVGKTVCRVILTDAEVVPDFIPVDTVIKMLLIGACWKATKKTNGLDVLNASSREKFTMSYKEMMDTGLNFVKYYSMKKQVWYPTLTLTKSPFLFTILFYILQLTPAIIIDGILRLLGNKPILLKIQRRVYAVSTSLKYFMLNRWIFNNNKMLEITKTIHPSDLECFRIDDNVIDVEMYTKSSFLGGSKYVLKEEVEKCGSVRKMYYVHKLAVYVSYVLLYWIVYKYVFVPFIIRIIYK